MRCQCQIHTEHAMVISDDRYADAAGPGPDAPLEPWTKSKLCLRCELPFRNKIDDEKYRWCLECRQKKRIKNKRERTAKKRKTVGNPSFADDIPTETHFKKFDSFDLFLDHIGTRAVGDQTDAIFQTVLTEFQVSRFPKHFNFVNIGAKTVVKNRVFLTQVSEDDEAIMNQHFKNFQVAPVVPKTTFLKQSNLVTSPILSLAGIYVEKRVGLIVVNQPESNSFFIQNSQKFLQLLVNKLLQSPYAPFFELNYLKPSILQEDIAKLFEDYEIDQYDALQAYKLFKAQRFSTLRDLPQLLGQFTVIPKLKDLDQAKLLRQRIDSQLIKYADKIGEVTKYAFARKRRDVSQNGNFVINHYCRQDSHYRKFPTIENKKTENCKSKLALFYNSITGDFKIVYSHREHTRAVADLNALPVSSGGSLMSHPVQFLDVADSTLDMNILTGADKHRPLEQAAHIHLGAGPDVAGVDGIAVNDLAPHGNAEWRNFTRPDL